MQSIRNAAVALAVLLAACDDGNTRGAAGPDSRAEGVPVAFGAAANSFTHPSGTIVDSAPLSGTPWGVDISSNDVAYITRIFAERIERVNLPSFAFVGSVVVGSEPYSVDFHSAGLAAWVANRNDTGISSSVGVIDVSGGLQARTFATNGNVFQVIAKPDGSTVYASSDDGTVYAFNAITDQMMAAIPVGGILSNGLAFHPDGVRLYASQFSGGTVTEINTATNTITRVYALGGGRLQGIAVARGGKEFYVADEDFAVLRVVNIATGVQRTVQLGGGGWGLALSPDNAVIYVSLSQGGSGCSGGGCVKVIDRATRTVIDTLQTRGVPRGIGFSRGGETAVIANQSGWVNFVQ